MRRYIRHPSDIPIGYQVSQNPVAATDHLLDISIGGLCFHAEEPIECGSEIHIHIPLDFSVPLNDGEVMEFDGDGTVAWCRKERCGYAIGVQFDDSITSFGMRMVEQVCHIERYRNDVYEEEGRRLSRDQAAQEWIERYAAEFPSISV